MPTPTLSSKPSLCDLPLLDRSVCQLSQRHSDTLLLVIMARQYQGKKSKIVLNEQVQLFRNQRIKISVCNLWCNNEAVLSVGSVKTQLKSIQNITVGHSGLTLVMSCPSHLITSRQKCCNVTINQISTRALWRPLEAYYSLIYRHIRNLNMMSKRLVPTSSYDSHLM